METIWILGDQLTLRHPAFERLTPRDAVVLMIESSAHARRVRYHKQKLVFLFSAMRHYAEELRGLGWQVDYRREQPSFEAGFAAHVQQYRPTRIWLMEPTEYGVADLLQQLAAAWQVTLHQLPTTLFVSDRQAFAAWARGKKTLVMEHFYRRMRRQTGLLIEPDGEPTGGTWNYDKDNRQVPPPHHPFPPLPRYAPDAITREVMDWVRRDFPDGYGHIEPFHWATTRADAEHFYRDFLDHRLDLFGPYEDAMVAGQSALYHSLASPYVNVGLLDPLEAARQAEKAYRAGKARLTSVEGVVRQFIGWREFIYQLYWLRMPDFATVNFFGDTRPLPHYYWDAKTHLRCLRETVTQLIETGHTHHIQRLMVLGNFALIAGVNPQEVNTWFWLAYLDAYEWVTLPNVLGMSLYADGGFLATKPYAASAAYINRMSDYCTGCAYDPKRRHGDGACPFNSLYWDFLDRHREKLFPNQRMRMMYAAWDTMRAAEREATLAWAQQILNRLEDL
ncbi:MAG: cryptochrome/photolyase family protein [Chloracidobacterium sp.]|uniref:Cryptochrome/photolyase family protein n=1 Tax=Chloracidobacterium validum TaxID=2821543 RepID=A0ABX8B4R4_9BACT|nr:cryptochrome/photolyase family protein [Chloracidobacterium validum]QUW01908.1 cryptochrome/photolyase family protein [Chloracidobacterium validum]